MIVAGARQPILIATRPVDFRCRHQALALMVQTELKLDPHSGVTVIFRSKRGDRLKILVAAVEDRMAASEPDPAKRKPQEPRRARALPESLPRIERVVEPDSIACPCGCGDMVRIGEDRSERLDYIPARYQVIVTIRPRYACPKGRTGVVQAKAPAHLLEGSWPPEALLAQIAVSKHSEHMPLNRQAVVMARHGVPIDRSVLADWMGRTGALVARVVIRLLECPVIC